MQDSICELVRKQEQNYITGSTTISKYVEFNQHENIEKIDAYLNSKHISGDTDSLGREKPFFNIVTAAVNIWYRATDIDRKDIRLKASKQSQILTAFLATVHLQNWMRKENFGAFLNEWGRSLARYGSTILKFVEKDGELHCMVMPWNRMIVDPIDFDAAPRIEILELTPAQLRQRKGYDQKMVEKLIDAQAARETIDKQKKDNRDNYIKVYEVHGELPLSFITGKEEDEKTYVQQMHVVSFLESKESKGDYEDFTLVKGRESKDPYMITHLIKEDGRTQAIGAVEHLFEAQWMTNHTAKAIKDQLDLASQLIFQTSDGNFVGRNMLTNIMTGDILIHQENQPLTQIQNNSHDITSLQSFAAQWQALAKEITSTPDAITGSTMPSGTAYRQVAILNQEAHSLFEIMTENKGLYIEDMLREYIIPYLKKGLDTSDEIAATLDSQGITQFDSMYVPMEVVRRDNEQLIKHILSPEFTKIGSPLAQNLDHVQTAQEVQNGLNTLGQQRFLKPSDIPSKTWKEIFKDFEWEVEVEVTDETTDKNTVLTTLSTVLQNIAANPMLLQDPNAKLIFNRILETTGAISPLEIAATPKPSPLPVQPVQPQIQPLTAQK